MSNNSINNEVYVPPRRVVLPSSPHQSAGPACHSLIRRLLPLWVYRFRQIYPLLLRSQAESVLVYLTFNVIWWTRYVTFLMADNAVDADAHRVPKTQTQRFVYARRDMEDGPLEIIPPEESMWYKFYVRNFYINQDAKLAKAFCNRFRLPYPQFFKLVEDIRSNNLFDQWYGYKSNNKKVLLVELLLLGSLRYLGRGWTFNDCEESTARRRRLRFYPRCCCCHYRHFRRRCRRRFSLIVDCAATANATLTPS